MSSAITIKYTTQEKLKEVSTAGLSAQGFQFFCLDPSRRATIDVKPGLKMIAVVPYGANEETFRLTMRYKKGAEDETFECLDIATDDNFKLTTAPLEKPAELGFYAGGLVTFSVNYLPSTAAMYGKAKLTKAQLTYVGLQDEEAEQYVLVVGRTDGTEQTFLVKDDQEKGLTAEALKCQINVPVDDLADLHNFLNPQNKMPKKITLQKLTPDELKHIDVTFTGKPTVVSVTNEIAAWPMTPERYKLAQQALERNLAQLEPWTPIQQIFSEMLANMQPQIEALGTGKKTIDALSAGVPKDVAQAWFLQTFNDTIKPIKDLYDAVKGAVLAIGVRFKASGNEDLDMMFATTMQAMDKLAAPLLGTEEDNYRALKDFIKANDALNSIRAGTETWIALRNDLEQLNKDEPFGKEPHLDIQVKVHAPEEGLTVYQTGLHYIHQKPTSPNVVFTIPGTKAEVERVSETLFRVKVFKYADKVIIGQDINKKTYIQVKFSDGKVEDYGAITKDGYDGLVQIIRSNFASGPETCANYIKALDAAEVKQFAPLDAAMTEYNKTHKTGELVILPRDAMEPFLAKIGAPLAWPSGSDAYIDRIEYNVTGRDAVEAVGLDASMANLQVSE